MTATVRAREGLAITPWRAALAGVAGLTLLRLVVLFLTPFELYPDEAQYWAWAQHPAAGYVSKPPMIAWLIRITTTIGGDAAPWVRLSAPLAHAGAALALFQAARRLYDERTGLGAAALYMLMPGVQLSAGLATTDAPLFFFLALALWAYAVQITARDDQERGWAALGLGAAMGAAWLSKYAAVYFLVGLVLHAACSPRARKVWSRRDLLAAAGLGLAALAPNMAWNLTHGLATLSHTVLNAGWGAGVPAPIGRPDGPDVYDFRDAPGFLLTQFGVFGPIPFAVLIVGGLLLAVRKRLEGPDRLLLCFVLPPLVIVLIQAVISRANANWGAAAYGAGSVLAAAWLVRWAAWRTLTAALAFQGVIAALFLVLAVRPALADRLGLANSVKQARGWQAVAQGVVARAQALKATGPVDAVAVDSRFLFNAMTYYGRDYFARPGAARLVMWMRRPRAYTQAEADAPLTPAEGRRVLGASLEGVYLNEMVGDFGATEPAGIVTTPLDAQRRRKVVLFAGRDFAPAPRDPKTGLPLPAAPPLED